MVLIQVLGQDESKNTLVSWEREDSYYSGMKTNLAGDLNIRARGFPYLQTKESKPSTITVDFEYPLEGPIQIVYLEPRSDSGLPHTRGRSGIALPVFLLWHPSDQTIRHELVHLSQKQYKTLWWSWYSKNWFFRTATESEFLSIPEKWRSRRRINPDTLGTPYVIWKDRYIAISVFSSDIRPDLRFCKRGFWDLQMSQWTWEEPPGWIDMFGSGFNDEHPNEIAAHWIDGTAGKEKMIKINIRPD
jgi:hypothetical protein